MKAFHRPITFQAIESAAVKRRIKKDGKLG